MDKTLRIGLDKKANQLGFDSAQAMLRYISKTLLDGRAVTFGEDPWGEPSPAAAKRLNKSAKEALTGKNISGPYNNVEDFMKDL